MKQLFVFGLVLFLLSGCAPAQAEPTAERTFFAMDTVMTLRLYEGGDEASLEHLEDRVKDLETRWSVTDENSEIYALNRDGEGLLSPETERLLDTALSMCKRTDGALDISIYPVLRAWGFTTGEYTVPDDETIATLLPLVDYTQVEYGGRSAAIPKGMEIDLGSVAKGYTGDILSDYLKGDGVTSALLDLGGNIQAIGAKPDGSPWRVGIRDPEGEGNLGVVEIIDQAVVTSGGYERYFEEDGVRYWHILDPRTGKPARNGLASVTVIGDDGALCDALSTALFVMGKEKAIAFWLDNVFDLHFELVLVEEDGFITYTVNSGFSPEKGRRTGMVNYPEPLPSAELTHKP